MINRLFNIVCWLTFVAVFVVAGCSQRYEEEVLAIEPDVEKITVTNSYTPRAIGAVGGYQAWMKTKELRFDCVVTFYKPDGSFYLTQQRHEVYPWSNSIRISAFEPQGRFTWQLSAEQFSVLEGADKVDALPISVCGRDFAEAILDIITAPVRFLDTEVGFDEEPKPVKMEGLWYYPIERASRDAEPYWSKVVFYQNTDSALVDMIWFADGGEGRFLAVRGYDYSKVEKKDVLVPAKIEIFKTDAGGFLQRRLAKIDYYLLKSVE